MFIFTNQIEFRSQCFIKVGIVKNKVLAFFSIGFIEMFRSAYIFIGSLIQSFEHFAAIVFGFCI